MADISYENLLVNKIQATKIKGRMSLKQYCLTDTGDEAENERRKRLLEEYSEKNKERINRISSGSNKKVWWKCREAGHEWETMVSTRSKLKSNCPFCCGQRVTKENSVLSYIEKNGTYGEKLRKEYSSENELGLDEISYGSGKRVWWKCSTCGYEWEAIVKNRVQHKQGCPFCSGRNASEKNSLLTYIMNNGAYGEKLKREYSPKNTLGLEEICHGSHERVIWKCSICKKEWTTILRNRTGVIKSGCPFCNKNGTSFPEQLIFYILKRELHNYEVFNRDKSEGREIDIYIPSLKFGVEYDGWLYHKERQDKDKEKYQLFQEKDLDIIRIIGKADDEPTGVECNLEYNITKDTELLEARDYIKDYLHEHYNIKIDISMTEDEIEECKREARKQIENTLGGFSLDELNIPQDEESEEEFEFLPVYL